MTKGTVSAHCLYGIDGKHAQLLADACQLIGTRACPHPEVLTEPSADRNENTCAGCLVALAASKRLRDPANPLSTLAHIITH